MQYTSRGLKKPDGGELYDINITNFNTDLVNTMAVDLYGKKVEIGTATPTESSVWIDTNNSDNKLKYKEGTNWKQVSPSLSEFTTLQTVVNNKVAQSATNGNILIDGVEKTVYNETALKAGLQSTEERLTGTEDAIRNLAEQTRDVVPDVTGTTYSKNVSISNSANDGQLSTTIYGNSAYNIVKNGNFSNSSTGWSVTTANIISTNNNELTFLASASGGRVVTGGNIINGHKYYARAEIKATSNNVYLDFGGQYFQSDGAHSGGGSYEVISYVYTHAIATGTRAVGVRDMRASAWDNITFKNLVVLDLTELELTGKTKAELDAMFPVWFDGLCSVVPGAIKSINKNMFDFSAFAQTLSTSYGSAQIISEYEFKLTAIESGVSTSYAANTYAVPVEPLTTYTLSLKRAGLCSFSSTSVTVRYFETESGTTTGNVSMTSDILTFTPPAGTKFIRLSFYISGAGNSEIYSNIQVEKGSSNTGFVKYGEQIKYYPDTKLHSLPCGVYDSINDMAYTKLLNEYTLLQADVTTLTTSYTNIDTLTISNANITGCVGTYSGATMRRFLFPGFTGSALSAVADDASYIYQYVYSSSVSANNIILIIPKGLYGTLDSAKAALAGTKIIYQLATPQTYNLLYSPLKASPNGTLKYRNTRGEVGFYGSNISVSNTTLPIGTIRNIVKVSIADGSETVLKASSAVISSDKLSFTHAGLTSGDLVSWDYEYSDNLAQTPKIYYGYKNNLFAGTSWTAPALLNNWVNHDVNYSQCGYLAENDGTIRLRGVVKSGTASTLFQLPVGYRPQYSGYYHGIKQDGTGLLVEVQAGGNVIISNYGAGYNSIDGISFKKA